MSAWFLQRFFQQLLVNFRRIVLTVRHFGGAIFEWHFGARWNNREPLERGRDRGKLKVACCRLRDSWAAELRKRKHENDFSRAFFFRVFPTIWEPGAA